MTLKILRDIVALLKKSGYVAPMTKEPVVHDLEIHGWNSSHNNESSISISLSNLSLVLMRENAVSEDVFRKACEKGYDYELAPQDGLLAKYCKSLEELPAAVKEFIEIDSRLYELSPSD